MYMDVQHSTSISSMVRSPSHPRQLMRMREFHWDTSVCEAELHRMFTFTRRRIFHLLSCLCGSLLNDHHDCEAPVDPFHLPRPYCSRGMNHHVHTVHTQRAPRVLPSPKKIESFVLALCFTMSGNSYQFCSLMLLLFALVFLMAKRRTRRPMTRSRLARLQRKPICSRTEYVMLAVSAFTW